MESIEHVNLLKKMLDFVRTIESITSSFIYYDLPESNLRPPRMIDGYIPDLYYEYNDNLIIGEAKTANDYYREHSLSQYRSFMQQCHFYSGVARFILIVPWTEYISAKQLISKIRTEQGYTLRITILDNIGKASEI